MRILALHGYMQNSTIMKKKMENLFGKNKHDIVCIEGLYVINSDSKGWWLLPNKDIFNKPHKYEHIEGLLTLNLPDKDFDLVVGFSQGAVAATILLNKGIIRTKYVVLMSGSDIMDQDYVPMDGSTLDIKALGIVGDSDTLCTIDDMNSLLKYYKNTCIIHHKYGHVIPTHREIKDAILTLMK